MILLGSQPSIQKQAFRVFQGKLSQFYFQRPPIQSTGPMFYFGAIVKTTQLVLPSSSFISVQWLTYFSSVLTIFRSPIVPDPPFFVSIPVIKPNSTLTAFPLVMDSLTAALNVFCREDDMVFSARTLKMSC